MTASNPGDTTGEVTPDPRPDGSETAAPRRLSLVAEPPSNVGPDALDRPARPTADGEARARSRAAHPTARRPRRSTLTVVGLVVAALLAAGSAPSGADLSSELEDLKTQQDQVRAEREASAANVDAATAEVGDLTTALESITAEVNALQADVDAAEQALAAAETRHDDATDAVDDQNDAIADLEAEISDRAISSFVNQNANPSPLLEEADPNVAVRMQSLVESVTDDGLSLTDELKTAREDLELEEARAADAETEAAELRAQLEADLQALEDRKAEQQVLVDEAEARLEAQLAEAWALEQTDAQLSANIVQKNEELAAQAAAAQRQREAAAAASGSSSGSSGGGGSVSTPTFPVSGDIVSVGGIQVHQSIAGNLQRLLDAASAEGHTFTGGGYRDPSSQIRLRRAHCGTSNYAIYQMPSSQCRPPTARPGRSNHEQGLAIDFRYNGGTITSRSNAGFKWLAANAGKYGFYNLPSEPWHWSVNGK
ncbi:MAG: D-alanyl-D-alanine carboxypeptidase family protein [Acidimicrobiales bacterium]